MMMMILRQMLGGFWVRGGGGRGGYHDVAVGDVTATFALILLALLQPSAWRKLGAEGTPCGPLSLRGCCGNTTQRLGTPGVKACHMPCIKNGIFDKDMVVTTIYVGRDSGSLSLNTVVPLSGTTTWRARRIG
jgi:hypothetical protein